VSSAVDSSALLALPDQFTGLSIWVVGDLMIDEYVSGAVERISPEAPVPVVRAQASEHRLGGAANVARQIATLGGHVSVAGICGDDAAGEQLLTLCGRAGIDTRAVLRLPGRHTTRKLRVVSHSQQLLRLDWEDAQPCTPEVSARLLAQLTAGDPPDAIILSDYAKGVLTPATIAAIVRARGAVPLVVDPKHRDFGRYRGATTVTPNLHELEVAAGRPLDVEDLPGVAAAARTLMASAGLESMVVTLGNHGMLVVPATGPEFPVPAMRHDVYDVTGAGDTAIAVLTLALAAHPDGKLLSRHELAARAATWRTAGKRIVLTNGCFDLLHAGHLALLSQAAKQGDVLVLAINSDASVRRLKGPERPLVPQAERAALLAALTFVDAVTIFEEDTPLAVLEAVRPNVLVKGGDYQPAEVVGRELVEAAGGRVVIVPLTPERSTSSLVARIRGARS